MGELHVISALRDKRAELSGMIQGLETKISQSRADLLHLDATLRLFAPDMEPDAIPAKAMRDRNCFFRNGECVRLALDVLREAPAPVSTMDLAQHFMKVKGIPLGDKATQALILKAAHAALRRAAKLVERVQLNGLIHWRINPAA